MTNRNTKIVKETMEQFRNRAETTAKEAAKTNPFIPKFIRDMEITVEVAPLSDLKVKWERSAAYIHYTVPCMMNGLPDKYMWDLFNSLLVRTYGNAKHCKKFASFFEYLKKDDCPFRQRNIKRYLKANKLTVVDDPKVVGIAKRAAILLEVTDYTIVTGPSITKDYAKASSVFRVVPIPYEYLGRNRSGGEVDIEKVTEYLYEKFMILRDTIDGLGDCGC